MAESVSLPASLRLTLGSMKAMGCSAATTEPDLKQENENKCPINML